MKINVAIAEAVRWLEFAEKRKERSYLIAALARKARRGSEAAEEARKELEVLDKNPVVCSVDMTQVIPALLEEIDRLDNIILAANKERVRV